MSKFKRLSLVTLLIVLLFAVGFLRDFLFVHINGQLYYMHYDKPNPYLPSLMEWTNVFTYWQLYATKYLLTLVFFLVYLLCSLWIVWLLFKRQLFINVTAISFSAVFVFSFIVFGIGLLTGFQDKAYLISRFIAGWVQSPLALFILIPTFSVWDKMNISAKLP